MFGSKNIISIIAIVLCLTSCHKDDSYSPFRASAIHNGVLISYTDAEGNDLLASGNVTNTISILGESSKKIIPFEIKSIEDRGESRNYLSFNAELPTTSRMVFNADKSEGHGESIVKLNICNKSLKLTCKFIYICSNPGNLGSNIIQLDCVECNGTSRSEKMNSQLVLELADYIDK